MTLRGLTISEILDLGWQHEGVLEELHQERGWSAADIARRFELDRDEVREELEERGIWVGRQNPPKNGFARQVWLQGTTPDAGGGGQA